MSAEIILKLLKDGSKGAAELLELSGLSQPTFSRIIKHELEGQVVRAGAARSTRYGLRRMVQDKSLFPVYRVLEDGISEHDGTLIPLVGDEWFYTTGGPQPGTIYEGLPWFIQDMRPQGYLGVVAAGRAPIRGFPPRITDWTDDHVVLYLSLDGYDTIGNLIVGERPYNIYLKTVGKVIHTSTFIDHAENQLMYGDVGSSAGGEQPKFAGYIVKWGELFGPAIVKFTGQSDPGDSSTRFRDTLIAEGLVQAPMALMGIVSAEYELLNMDHMTFLMVKRFDRFMSPYDGGRVGRKGVVSLDALDNCFIGKKNNFSSSAIDLLDAGLITQETANKIQKIYLFGTLINNTDMHQGNLSFHQVPGDKLLFELAPVYDMLPMGYRPTQNMVPKHDFVIPNISEHAKPFINEVMPAVVAYWNAVIADPDISDGFKLVAAKHLEIVQAAFGPVPA